jgi:Kef-type K+ transport system membrane component KefB
MLVAYIVLGALIGPSGLGLINDPDIIRVVGDIGIIFLLFLLGLNLPPQKLWNMLRNVSWLSLISSVIFGLAGYLVAAGAGYTTTECLIVGAATMFSSTIIGIKLLPTTVLHHQHTGEVMISILLLQDLIAIAVLLLMHGAMDSGVLVNDVKLVMFGLPVTLVFAFLFQRFVLQKLFSRFNRIREYTFLVAIAWCLGMAQLATYFGLSAEIGAFIAGITLASSPISLYIAESMRPVRDFFLIMFFFSVGASFNLHYLRAVAIPVLILTALVMVLKPVVYRFLLGRLGEPKHVGWEVGTRLGQLSEFSLIIAYVGLDTQLIGSSAANFIEATTILTFVISSYWVVCRYSTPVALVDRLRRD